MALKLANNAVSKLAGAVSAAATSFAVTPGEGAKFPALGAGDWFPLTVVKSNGSFEVMRCTARAIDTLTVSRAQENTAALGFDPGDRVELRMTNAAFGAYLQQDAIANFLTQDQSDTRYDARYDIRYMPIAGTSKKVSSTVTDTNYSMLVQNNGGSGDSSVAALGFLCQGTYGIKLYLRADGYFGLGGWSTTAWKWYVDPAGNMVASGNVSAYSDESIKTNWREFDDDFIERLADVKHGNYDRTDIEGLTQVGVSAQSLEGVLEHAVMRDKNGKLSVAYGNAALASVIRLSRRVVELERKLKDKGVLE